MRLFQGLSAFPLTPADEHGRVDTPALDRLLERLVRAGVDSIGLLGSTGGYAYLSRSERRRALDAAVGCVQRQRPLMVGVGALRTDDAQALARDARDAGADALLMAPVSYTPLTEEEVFQHYRAVAEATDLPLCIYNNPGTTHFTFSHALLARLAAVPNIQAVKMPLPGDQDFAGELRRLRQDTPAGFAIGYSGDWGGADALLAGARAWYSVVAGLLPVPTLRLARAAQAGDTAETRRLEDLFRPMWALFQEFGSLRVMYVAARLLSLGEALPPRPLLPLPRAQWPRVEQALAALSTLDETLALKAPSTRT